MQIKGLVVDTDAIGAGIYGLIVDAGKDHIVAYGMIPQEFAEAAERLVREKIVSLAASQTGCSADEVLQYIDPQSLSKEYVSPILHDISLGIFKAARLAGRLVV